MRILLATYWSVPHVGGVWSYMVQLKKKLESMGHEVDLLGNGDDEESSFVYMVNENRRLSKAKLLPLLKAKLNEAIYPILHANSLVQNAVFQGYVYELAAAYFNLEKYDVIHTQDVISTVCINRVRSNKTPLVATIHGCIAYEMKHKLTTMHQSPTDFIALAYYNALEHQGATSAEITNVANEWLRNAFIQDFKVPKEQINVFQYGFDTVTFMIRMKLKSKVERPVGKKIIIYTGRLVELKGIHYLLPALCKLKEIRQDWVCWIVGHGVNQAELEIQSKALGLEEDVVFWGKRDDVPYLLSISDIFVLPSIIENQSISLIEAQIAGIAAIVSHTGGLPEMVEHEVTGLLSPVGDTKSLCDYLELLLENEEYRNMLASNAQKWGMTHWSLDTMIGRLLDIYQKAIDRRKQYIVNL
jgi:glycosyltransferase involved in cell wall biosynthesis